MELLVFQSIYHLNPSDQEDQDGRKTPGKVASKVVPVGLVGQDLVGNHLEKALLIGEVAVIVFLETDAATVDAISLAFLVA